MLIRYYLFVVFLIALLLLKMGRLVELKNLKDSVGRSLYFELISLKGIGEKRALERLLAM